MKSVIKGVSEDKQEELVFPVLMEYVGHGDGMFVLLFTGNTTGVVVYSKNPNRYVGELYNEWEEIYGKYSDSYWKKFTGTVELSN